MKEHRARERSIFPGSLLGAKSYPVLVLFLLAVVAFGACSSSSEDDTGQRRATRDTVDQVVIVENRAPLWGDTAKLVETLRIGGGRQETRHEFFDITALAVGPDGSIYVADRKGTISRFDSDGVFDTTIASYGRGPGEVRNVTAILPRMDGGVIVRDVGNNRLVWYSRDGSPVRSRRLEGSYPMTGARALGTTAGSGLLLGWSPYLPRDGSAETLPRPMALRLDTMLAAVDTVMLPERLSDRCPTRSRRKFKMGWYRDLRSRYLPKPQWSLGLSGTIVFGCPADFRFEIHRDGQLPVRVRRPHEPVRVSREERETYKELWITEMHNIGPQERWQQWEWTGPPLSDEKPVYHRLLVGSSGRIWTANSQPASRQPAPERFPDDAPDEIWVEPAHPIFTIFAPDGQWLTNVKAPEDLAFDPLGPAYPDPVIRGDTVWAIVTNDLDEQFPARFELRNP